MPIEIDLTLIEMDFAPRRSFDGERQNGFEDTLRSDQSSMMDFSKHGIFVERTLALIKPDAVQKTNEIETVILQHGFTILHVNFHFHLLTKSRFVIVFRNDVLH